MSLVYAAILIGVLIFVHELGHFLVAKLFDVKVLRFSIGFGPKVVGFRRGETEYVICALPLGGYVQMLGMTMETTEDIPEEDLERALMAKPIWQRSLVTLAGPAFNLVFPVLIYLVVLITMNTQVAPSTIGEVFPDMPAAAAGLQPGDEIVEIEGEEVEYWHQVIEHITPNPDQKLSLTYERDGTRHQIELTPQRKESTDFLGLNDREYGLVGIHSGTYGPTLGIVTPDSPAAQAGLKSFDRVLTVNGEVVDRFDEIESKIRASEGKPLEFAVWRRDPIPVQYGQFYGQHRENVTVPPEKTDGEWSIGIRRAEMFLSAVEDGAPADEAGLQIGDEILEVDGKPFSNWLMMNRYIENEINEDIARAREEETDVGKLKPEFEITYRRGGQTDTTTLVPVVRKLDMEDYYRVVKGWGHIPDMVFPERVPFGFGERVVYSVEQAFERTGEFIRMTFMGIVRMAQGRLSLSNVGGPIMIGELAAQAGRAGWDKFLEMMALISINLGLINLLPIPILDGGNLMLYALEAIKRGPLSFRTRQIAAYIGFSMIIMLIVLAFKNDIERQWDNISEYVNEL
jgi:regulator of sigma E protease